MSFVTDLLEGFWTYQTPVSFLAGVGAYHIYSRLRHKSVYDDVVYDVIYDDEED